MYQKEIVYMNLFENDIKNGCVGYLKIEKKQENYCLELQVKNVPNMFSGSFPIRFQGENDWKEADMLSIKGGCGKWTGTMEESVTRAEVILTDAHRIKGECKNAQASVSAVTTKEDAVNYAQTIERSEQSDDNLQVVMRENNTENYEQVSQVPNKTNNNEQIANAHKAIIPIVKAEKVIEQNNNIKKNIENKKENKTESITENKLENKIEKKPTVENAQLYESKWEQLLATYEQIHPYGDSRVYVKLEPKDFIILRSNYQHLVNNSFLLHGFYNYRYVILGKEKDFYIGVPGVFYEREKMVALMFGFEAFECEGGDAEEGKFGYYLRKVEI